MILNETALAIGDWSTLVGLVITGLGAWRTATSVILSEDDAISIGVSRFAGTREENLKAPMVQNLLAASRGARQGLWIIVLGTALQVVPLAVKLIVTLLP